MIYDFILLLKNPFLRKKSLLIWAAWALATTAGWFAAGLTSLPIGRVVVVEGGTAAILSVAGSMSLIGALIGALVSTGQWFFLRRRFPAAYWWVLSGSIGWGLGLPLALVINLMFGLGISAGLYGLFVGAVVALMQRLLFPAAVQNFMRWFSASLLAFVLGISGAGWLERSLLISTQGAWGAQSWQTGLTAGGAGMIVGLVTGIVMTQMLVSGNQTEGFRNA